ncbi:MAG: hypothetical protein ABI981_07315 [Betaproteobacteria bacterium]
MTTEEIGEERPRLLDPLDRLSEVLFGLIMAVTIVGSLSIATAGKVEVRTVMIAALGCNLAWGLVDAVMYVVRNAAERARLWKLGQRVRVADAATAQRLIAQALPDHLASIVGEAEIDAMRQRLLARPPAVGPLLRGRDFLEAVGVFALVVLATFPVVLPFMFFADTARAFLASQITTVVMLFITGSSFGRYATYPHPWRTGFAMAFFGVVLIAAVKALGG